MACAAVEPAASARDYARIGFGVPVAIAVAADAFALWQTWNDNTGYQGLFFIFLILAGILLTVVWMIVGAIVLRGTAPAGSARRFAAGAGVALGVIVILFAATCFATYM